MTPDLIRLAREAGIDERTGWRDNGAAESYYEAWPEQLARFAELVAQECARVCEQHAADHEESAREAIFATDGFGGSAVNKEIATRRRGK